MPTQRRGELPASLARNSKAPKRRRAAARTSRDCWAAAPTRHGGRIGGDCRGLSLEGRAGALPRHPGRPGLRAGARLRARRSGAGAGGRAAARSGRRQPKGGAGGAGAAGHAGRAAGGGVCAVPERRVGSAGRTSRRRQDGRARPRDRPGRGRQHVVGAPRRGAGAAPAGLRPPELARARVHPARPGAHARRPRGRRARAAPEAPGAAYGEAAGGRPALSPRVELRPAVLRHILTRLGGDDEQRPGDGVAGGGGASGGLSSVSGIGSSSAGSGAASRAASHPPSPGVSGPSARTAA
eukprot:scaffold3902_cov140-Isochrysis_galbana.AAC.3